MTLVFGDPYPKLYRGHLMYGIRLGGKLVAVTVVNPNLRGWHWPGADEQKPEVGISVTAVHPSHRRRGLATRLRRYLQRRYSSVVTGVGSKSDRKAMRRLNEHTGFRLVWERGKSSVWFWRRRCRGVIMAKTTISLYEGRFQSWMKPGAICEVWGEGKGRLFRVTAVERGLKALQLESYDTRLPQGREGMHKCYRSYLARKAEGSAEAPKPPRRGVNTKKLRVMLCAPSMAGLPGRAEFLEALDELDRLRAGLAYRLKGAK